MASKTSGSPTVGIDIGSSFIKVAEAKPTKDGIQVTALGVAPTPPGAIENEIVVDPQALGQAIKQLLTESGVSCRRSISSVAGQSSVIVRIIEVPKMTKQELAETMKWEIERHVPFSASEVIMDFIPIERPDALPDDQNMEVLLAVAQQETINSHVETLFAAGLDPVVVDVEALAASRSLVDSSTNGLREQTVAVINIGAAATELAVFANGLLSFPRTLPIAGDAITRAISDSFSISIEQAERLKREKAVVLMDRAVGLSSGPGVSPVAGFGGADDAVDIIPPETQDDPDLGYGFIPGLGYGVDAPEEQKPEEPGVPDFDIDIGGADVGPRPVMDFDLSTGDEPSTGPEPHADASGLGESLEEADTLAPVPDQAGASEQPDLPPEAIFDAMAPVLSDLIAEIRRSLEYFSSRYHGQPSALLLCGGTARLKDLDRLVEAELGIPTVVANPLQNVTVMSKSLTEDYVDEVASIFPVSVGLAIRDMIGD